MPTKKETAAARNAEALAKLPPPFLPPSVALAREWRPSGAMQREIVPLVLIPAMRYYARLAMGTPASVPPACHQATGAFRTARTLVWWLRDDYQRGRLIPPAATAAAWWALEDEERASLEFLIARDGDLAAVTQGRRAGRGQGRNGRAGRASGGDPKAAPTAPAAQASGPAAEAAADGLWAVSQQA